MPCVVFLPYRIDKSCFARDHHEELRQVVCDCYFDLCSSLRKAQEKEAWWILGSGLAAFRRM